MRESSFTSRDNLIEAAFGEFTEYNYEKASLNRIIKNAGISKGTFYYHFKNKQDLYKHLLLTSVKSKWAYINEFSKEHQADFDSMDIFDKFLYQAKSGTLYATKNPILHKFASMFAKEKGSQIYETLIDEIGGDSTTMLKAMVHDAYLKGEIDPSYTEDFVYNLLLNLFGNFDDIFHDDLELDKRLENLEAFVRFMKHGLVI